MPRVALPPRILPLMLALLAGLAHAQTSTTDAAPRSWSLVVEDQTRGPVVLREVRWSLDGAAPTTVAVPADTPKGTPLPIHTGPIAAGGHALVVTLVFEGTGYGVFAYHRGYTYEVQRDHGLEAEDGLQTAVSVVARDDGPLRRPFPERAVLAFSVVQRAR